MIESKAIQQLDLNLLKVFEALYFEQNMTSAAKALHITPSAVSHAIKRLRHALNDPLFVRQGQQMKPTPACQRMAPELIELITRLKQLLQTCGKFTPEATEQTFKIATHEALEPMIVPNIVTALADLAPMAQLASVSLDRELLTRQLATGEIDLAIDIARPLKKPIYHQRLSSNPFCVLANKRAFSKGVTKQQYLATEHLVVSNRPTGRVLEDFAFHQQGINRKIKMRCQSYPTACNILKQHDLLLTLPQLIAQQYCNDDLVIWPLPIKVQDIEVHLYWHENSTQDDALIWLREQILR